MGRQAAPASKSSQAASIPSPASLPLVGLALARLCAPRRRQRAVSRAA
ncbi:MYXO-CTERM sorting domain-containing protein [Accumulibacter sp.]